MRGSAGGCHALEGERGGGAEAFGTPPPAWSVSAGFAHSAALRGGGGGDGVLFCW